MILFRHEMNMGKKALLLWTAAISLLLGICILIYPEMAGQMNEISTMFADMGSFTQAFGMDQLNFGEFKGYFGIECGNVLGMGGAMFAALLGISTLSKEEKDHTAEFLLTHPISRTRVFLEKLLAVFGQIIVMNLIVSAVTLGVVLIIEESLPWKETLFLLLAFLLMELQIASITFGISSFLRGGSLGLGLGLSLMLYVLNLISNLIEEGKILKYITPYAYADSAHIFSEGTIQSSYLLVGWCIAIGSHVKQKDIL